MDRRIFAVLCVTLAGSLAVGCGESEGPKTSRVYGEVTLGGKPLDDGTIEFSAADGGHAAQGQIKAGTYDIPAPAGPIVRQALQGLHQLAGPDGQVQAQPHARRRRRDARASEHHPVQIQQPDHPQRDGDLRQVQVRLPARAGELPEEVTEDRSSGPAPPVADTLRPPIMLTSEASRRRRRGVGRLENGIPLRGRSSRSRRRRLRRSVCSSSAVASGLASRCWMTRLSGRAP